MINVVTIIKEAVNNSDDDLYHSSVRTRINFFKKNADHVTPDHISVGLRDPDYSVREWAAAHKNNSVDNISQAIRDPDFRIRIQALQKTQNDSDLDYVADNEDQGDVLSTFTTRKLLKPHHVTKLLDKKLNPSWVHPWLESLPFRPAFEQQHIDQLIDKHREHFSYRNALANAISSNHPSITSKHIDRIVDNRVYSASSNLQRAVLSSPRINAFHIDKLIKDKDWEVRYLALHNPSANQNHFKQAIKDTHPTVADWAHLMVHKRPK